MDELGVIQKYELHILASKPSECCDNLIYSYHYKYFLYWFFIK